MTPTKKRPKKQPKKAQRPKSTKKPSSKTQAQKSRAKKKRATRRAPQGYAAAVTATRVTIVRPDGQPLLVSRGHLYWDRIRAAIAAKDWATAVRLADMKQALAKWTMSIPQVVQAKVNIEFQPQRGLILVNGRAMPGLIAKTALQMVESGRFLQEAMARFLAKLSANDLDPKATEGLLAWIDAHGLALWPNGNFLAWKSITLDYLDHHTRTFVNHPGRVLSMSRDLLTVDPETDCAAGFHVSDLDFAYYFSGCPRLIYVQVNPRDVGSVPRYWESANKIRVLRYRVQGEVPKSDAARYLTDPEALARHYTETSQAWEATADDMVWDQQDSASESATL